MSSGSGQMSHILIRDHPGTGFDDYLATPERIASWVAELAG